MIPAIFRALLTGAALLISAVAHADPQAAPKANKAAEAKAKAPAPVTAAPVARRLRRIEKKQEAAQPASVPVSGSTQAREITIEGRPQGPGIVFHIEKAPMHFELHDLGGPYSHDLPEVDASAKPATAPPAPPPAAAPAARAEKK